MGHTPAADHTIRNGRRGVGRRRALTALLSLALAASSLAAAALPSPAAAAVDGPLTLESTGGLFDPMQVGARVLIDNIPPEVLSGLSNELAAAPIGSIPIGSIPIGSIPIGSIPIGSIPIGSIPIGSIPIGSIPIGSIPIGSIGGWAVLLEGIPEFDRPLQTITFGEIVAYIQQNPGSSLAALTVGDIDLSQTPIGSINLASLVLGPMPIGSIPLDGQAGTEAERMALWCDLLASLDVPCAPAGVITSTSTILTLDVMGAPIGSIPIGSIPIGSIPIGSIPIGSIPIGSIALQGTPIGSIPIGSIPIGSIPIGSIPIGSIPIGSIGLIFDCELVDCGDPDLTLAQAAAAGAILDTAQLHHLGAALDGFVLADLEGAFPPDLTLGDLLLSMVDPVDFPWEDLPLAALGLQQWADASDGPTGQRHTFTFNLTFAEGQGADSFHDVEVLAELPGSMRFHLGAARWEDNEPPLWVELQTPEGSQWELGTDPLATVNGPLARLAVGRGELNGAPGEIEAIPAGSTAQVHVNVLAPLHEQIADIVVTVRATDDQGSTWSVTEGQEVEAAVPQFGEACNSVPDDLPPGCSPIDNELAYEKVLLADELRFQTSGPGDHDYFRVAAPPPGHRLSVYVTGLGDDASLALFRAVPVGPLTGEPSVAGLGAVPVSSQLDPSRASAGQLSGAPAGEFHRGDLQLMSYSDIDGLGDEVVSVVSDGESDSYFVRVTGSSDIEGNPPYMVRARHVPVPAEITCAPRVLPPAQSGLDLPEQLPEGVNTLFIYAGRRIEQTYGLDALTDVATALFTLSGQEALGVRGAPLSIDFDPTVRAAYEAWDANPCSVSGANAVVTAISDAVEDLIARSPGAADTIESIVLVGSDDLIPMGRVPDLTRKANEYNYAPDLRAADGSPTPLSAAAETQYIVTDDPYGDSDPYPFFDRYLYVPDRAVGRLVETPAEIVAQVDQFIASGGVLDASTALTTGYDFLSDGAERIDEGLGRRLSDPGTRTLLNPEPWDREDLDQALFPVAGESPGIASVNAHYDHAALLPAIGSTFTEADLYTTADIVDAGPARLAGRLLFTMGCHGGTNVPDIYVGSTGRELDWAQVTTGAGASWVGNTGFGLGDDATVALSERLMALYAERLDGHSTVGAALADAKAAYLSGLGAYSDFDEKVLMQVVYYGLPMYRLDEPVGPPRPANEPAPVTSPDPTGIQSASLQATPTFEEQTAPDGSTFVVADGEDPQVTVDRPILPRVARTFEQGPLPLRDVIVTSLTSQAEDGVENSVANPIVADSDEGSRRLDSAAFPSQLVTVNQAKTPTGVEETVVLLPGRFIADDDPGTPTGTGRRELFTSVGMQAYYSDDPDHVEPVIVDGSAEMDGSDLEFTVRVIDLDENPFSFPDTVRAVVMHRTPGGIWRTVEMANQGRDATGLEVWTGSLRLRESGVGEWFVQVVDAAGNVSVDAAQGRMKRISLDAPDFDAGEEASAHVGEVVRRRIAVTDSDSTRFTATVDWGEGVTAAQVEGPEVILTTVATRPGDQDVTVRVCDDGGLCSEDTFVLHVEEAPEPEPIDQVPPVVTGQPDRDPDSAGWYRQPVTVTWTAVDPAPSSGPASQPAPTVVSTDGADQTVTSGESCDAAGNCATGSVTLSYDGTAPQVAITSNGLRIPLLGGTAFTGTASDGLSGVTNVTVTYQPLVGAAVVRSATLSCGSGGACTWTATLPPLGIYTATVQATDAAGNVATTSQSLVVVLI